MQIDLNKQFNEKNFTKLGSLLCDHGYGAREEKCCKVVALRHLSFARKFNLCLVRFP